MTDSDAQHESEVDRRYICDSCETVVRARYRGVGSFCVGCDCTTVPVVPQMGQAETPERWRVEREECCRGVEVSTMETAYGELGADYRCTECGAMYTWDGEMQKPPKSPDTDPWENERLVTDGGVDQSEAATTHVDPIRAEAESIVETYNTAKPDHSPPLSWFGMTTLRDGDDVREGFVFDVDGYLDRDGWEAVRWHGRVIDSVDARDETDEEYEVLDAALSVIIPVEDDVIPEGARTDPDSISEVSADAN